MSGGSQVAFPPPLVLPCVIQHLFVPSTKHKLLYSALPTSVSDPLSRSDPHGWATVPPSHNVVGFPIACSHRFCECEEVEVARLQPM